MNTMEEDIGNESDSDLDYDDLDDLAVSSDVADFIDDDFAGDSDEDDTSVVSSTTSASTGIEGFTYLPIFKSSTK